MSRKRGGKKPTRRLPYRVRIAALVYSAFFVAMTAQAASFDTISFKPATDQGNYLTVDGSNTLGHGGFALGVTGEYSKNSYPGVIDKQLTFNLGGAIGLSDWLNIGANVTGVPMQEFTVPGSAGVRDDGGRMGDILVNVKAKLFDNNEHPVGFALVPFVTIPTGDDAHYVGNGNVTGGANLVLDTKRISDRVSFALNSGAQFRPEPAVVPGYVVEHQFLYGGAVNVQLVDALALIGEVDGWTPFDDFFGSQNIEVNGAVRFMPNEKQNFAITAGAGPAFKDGLGAPDWRVFATVAYRQPRKEKEPEAEPIPAMPAAVKEEVITTNEIHFAFNKSTIRPESHKVLEEILAGIQGRPEVQNVRVEGHTDSVGSDSYNQTLSEERANSVRAFLVNKGYPSEKITAVGMGETSPIADNSTKDGRSQNRRVEFHLQVQPGTDIKVQKKDGAESPKFQEGDNVKEGRRPK